MLRIGKRLAGLSCVLAVGLVARGQGTQAERRPTAAPAAKKAQAAPAQPAAPIDPRKLGEILARWEKSSAGIRTLYAEFDKIDTLKVAGVEKKYRGKAYLERPNHALLQFDMQDPEKPDEWIFHGRIVSTGREVLDFDATVRQVLIYPLPEDQGQRAMEEGPLQFLFGMSEAAFRARYDARLVQESAESYRMKLMPLHEIDKQAFQFAVLDLNKKTLLPDAIYLMNPNGKDRQAFLLTKIKPNATWDRQDTMFTFTAADEKRLGEVGWKVIRNAAPGPEGPELQAAPRGPVGLAPGPGAARPR